MFLHLSVILFTGGGCTPPSKTPPPGQTPPPPPPPTATEAGGTHPTGMHSWWKCDWKQNLERMTMSLTARKYLRVHHGITPFFGLFWALATPWLPRGHASKWQNHSWTRIHSSRMRTVRCNGRRGGGCLPGGVYPSMHRGRHPPNLWTEWQTHVKT